MRIIRLGTCETTYDELSRNAENGNIYVVHFRTVYQIRYSVNGGGYYAKKIYYHEPFHGVPLMKRGRFMFCNGETVNRLTGVRLVDETITTV